MQKAIAAAAAVLTLTTGSDGSLAADHEWRMATIDR